MRLQKREPQWSRVMPLSWYSSLLCHRYVPLGKCMDSYIVNVTMLKYLYWCLELYDYVNKVQYNLIINHICDKGIIQKN